MRAFRFAGTTIAFAALTASAVPAYAQQQDAAAQAQALQTEIDQLKKDFDARLTDLEMRLAALGGSPPVVAEPVTPVQTTPPTTPATPTPATTAEVPSGAQGAGGPTGSLPVYGNTSAASKVFNPDMAVIGNFLGATGHNEVAPLPALQLSESEVSLQAVVDPYARADFFLSFGETGVEVEEGFATFNTLPFGLLAKVGKMRAAFGKVNTMHTHQLPWTDRPLVTDNLVGGDEGIDDAGISVSGLIPNKWIFLEATGQVFRGDSDDVFHSAKRGDLSYVGHLRGYQDLSESTNIDLGVSWARGHNPSGIPLDGNPEVFGRFITNLYGVDGTVRWRPLRRSIYHSFIGRGEYIVSRRDQPDGLQNSSGWYLSGDYQLGRRWFGGVRFDRSDLLANADQHDTGQSLVLTYWPSEFNQIRGQYRRTNYAGGFLANEFLFQFQFIIGAHGAHPF
jgi:hypothetical protein